MNLFVHIIYMNTHIYAIHIYIHIANPLDNYTTHGLSFKKQRTLGLER